MSKKKVPSFWGSSVVVVVVVLETGRKPKELHIKVAHSASSSRIAALESSRAVIVGNQEGKVSLSRPKQKSGGKEGREGDDKILIHSRLAIYHL
mmetsp:Transcript_60265/g.147949  ORF Transcript_60265/g.147949 Transcript_60265/m.147949 type:complete len:94 (+) Transcript_60265:60-341(+)